MIIHTRLEDVGIARECERRQIAAIGAAPDADAFGIDARLALQKMRAGLNVLIFGSAGVPRMIGLMEGAAVADAEAVIDRQHDEAVRRQILIHRIGVGVIIKIVPAEQHLSRRSAVNENNSGLPRAVLGSPE